MKKNLWIAGLLAMVWVAVASCADHDDPTLAPIDASQVKITATVSDVPNASWMTPTQELTISVQNLEMTAPKGVVLKHVSLVANTGLGSHVVDQKPYSGQAMEFKVPLTGMRGRVNYSLRGTLVKKDCRDTEIMIADNIQKIVFSEEPEFECEGWLYVNVKSKSTTGEEYEHAFEVKSSDHFTIAVPQSELYWTPASGTASTLELSIGSGCTTWSPNTTFEGTVRRTSIGHSSGDPSTLKLTIPNTPGSLAAEKLQLYASISFYGTWEDVTIEPMNISWVFDVTEGE